ncbi:MAG: MFS transporter, partial [Rhodospirillales bacterium]|nr:MFS transporter [Rhodospirillales bacterium]
SAYGFSYLFAQTGNYILLFQLGAGALLLALAIDFAVAGICPPTRYGSDHRRR